MQMIIIINIETKYPSCRQQPAPAQKEGAPDSEADQKITENVGHAVVAGVFSYRTSSSACSFATFGAERPP